MGDGFMDNKVGHRSVLQSAGSKVGCLEAATCFMVCKWIADPFYCLPDTKMESPKQ